MMQLSAHFDLAEMTASQYASRNGIDNTPGQAELANLRRLCNMLEQVRVLAGKPIIVSSGYRNPKVNAAIGGSKTSQHILGCAADIRGLGMSPDDLMLIVADSKIQYDQVIREFNSWVHISVPNTSDGKPRRQALIIDRTGTRPYK